MDLIRYCPECGHVGPIDNTKHINCCPDGNAAIDVPDRLIQERETLRSQRDAAIQMLAEWCCAIQRNGTGWDDWDEHYKDASFRPGPLRELINVEMAKHRTSDEPDEDPASW